VQWTGWSGAVASLAAAAIGFGGAGPVQAQENKGPVNFSTQAFAAGIRYVVDTRPGLAPIPELVAANGPEGLAAFDTVGNVHGQASNYDPRGASGAGDIYCLAAPAYIFPEPFPQVYTGCPKGFPPPFPLTAYAEYPGHEDAIAPSSGVTQDAGVIKFEAQSARAHADPTDVLTHAALGGMSGVAAAGPFKSGNSAADTHSFVDKGDVVVESTAAVNDIDIIGVIKIGGIVGRTTTRLDGKKKPVYTAKTTVSNVTVAGHPARIDDDGIHIEDNGDADSFKRANTALQLVTQYGVTVQLVGDTKTERAGGVNVQAGGVRVTYAKKIDTGVKPKALPPIPNCFNPFPPDFPLDPCNPPAPPNPNRQYIGTQVIGSAGIDAEADNFEFEFPPIPIPTDDLGGTVTDPGDTGTVSDPGTTGSGTVTDPGFTSGGNTNTGGSPTGSGGALPTAAPGVIAGQRPIALGTPLDPKGRMKFLALALLLGGVAILAGRAGKAPARLPRAI
jgi:hypothetical protein